MSMNNQHPRSFIFPVYPGPYLRPANNYSGQTWGRVTSLAWSTLHYPSTPCASIYLVKCLVGDNHDVKLTTFVPSTPGIANFCPASPLEHTKRDYGESNICNGIDTRKPRKALKKPGSSFAHGWESFEVAHVGNEDGYYDALQAPARGERKGNAHSTLVLGWWRFCLVIFRQYFPVTSTL